MEHLTSSELQKLLEDEATTLHIMHSKISNQIHLLQVEEELFRQELEKLQRGDFAKDYPNQQGVNQIVEVTQEDIARVGSDCTQITQGDRADSAINIVEIANDDLHLGVPETQSVTEEEREEGVNKIVEITGDEDEIMRESNSEGYGQASTSSLPWSEQLHALNLEYQILEPSSDESESDVEASNTGQKSMFPIISPSDVAETVVGEKRERQETNELNSEMEVEESTDDQLSPAVSHARSPPRKKQTPRRKTIGS